MKEMMCMTPPHRLHFRASAPYTRAMRCAHVLRRALPGRGGCPPAGAVNDTAFGTLDWNHVKPQWFDYIAELQDR